MLKVAEVMLRARVWMNVMMHTVIIIITEAEVGVVQYRELPHVVLMTNMGVVVIIFNIILPM